MEEAGFKVYKDFKTSQKIIDIYGVLPTVIGDFGVVVACKNYDKQWEVGIDILKEMEMIGRNLKVSKVAIVSSSNFSSQARNYASKKNIRLVDRDNLMVLAKKFPKKKDNYNSYNDSYSANYDDGDFDGSSNYYDEYGNPMEVYPPYDSERNYPEDKTYIYGKSSAGLGRNVSTHNPRHSPRRGNTETGLVKTNYGKPSPSVFERLRPILKRTEVLIPIVVLISYLLSTLLGTITGSNGISNLVKILSALILSYGLVVFFDREGTAILVKGSIIFFVSLVIFIIMIIFL